MSASTSAATVSVRRDDRPQGAVAHVTIENAAKLNTLGHALMIDFVSQVEALAAREDLRAVVLTGAGPKAFIGGANIREMAALVDALMGNLVNSRGLFRLTPRRGVTITPARGHPAPLCRALAFCLRFHEVRRRAGECPERQRGRTVNPLA